MRLHAAGEWFYAMSPEHQAEYIKEHPSSKYAKEAVEKVAQPPSDKAPDPKQVKGLHQALSAGKDVIANSLKDRLKNVTGSASALKALSTGKPLTDDHKEALKGVAKTAVNVALDHVPGGPAAKLLSRIGVNLVMIGFKKMRNRKSDIGDQIKAIVESLIDEVQEMIPLKANMKLNAASRLKKVQASWQSDLKEITEKQIVDAINDLSKVVDIKSILTDGYDGTGCEIHFTGKDPQLVQPGKGAISAKNLRQVAVVLNELAKVDTAFTVDDDGEFVILLLWE